MLQAPLIKVGDYVIIQRQKYTKLHKFSSLDSTAMMGKQKISLRNIADEKFFTTFKMIPIGGKGKFSINSLEPCSEAEVKNLREALGVEESGRDNRNIYDDGESQGLKADDIDKLREECSGSSKLIEKIVEHSKTFSSKTEYSQEKYLKKKEKKYFEFVRIRQPTIRLIAEIYFRQDPEQIMGVRMDTLSQIISYSGISAFGNYLLYDSGSNGLLAAAFLNSMGAGTEAKLVNLHPGNVPQRKAILTMNFPEEQVARCVSVNIYSVLRQYYQGNNAEVPDVVPTPSVETTVGMKRKAEEPADNVEEKKPKLEDESEDLTKTVSNGKHTTEKQKWQIENERALGLMEEKFDSLVIVAREHPHNILKSLLPFLKSSRPIVVYSSSREVLMELYVDLKSSNEITALHLTSNWVRMYQILPNRTHPEVNMNGNGGFLLTGYSVG